MPDQTPVDIAAARAAAEAAIASPFTLPRGLALAHHVLALADALETYEQGVDYRDNAVLREQAWVLEQRHAVLRTTLEAAQAEVQRLRAALAHFCHDDSWGMHQAKCHVWEGNPRGCNCYLKPLEDALAASAPVGQPITRAEQHTEYISRCAVRVEKERRAIDGTERGRTEAAEREAAMTGTPDEEPAAGVSCEDPDHDYNVRNGIACNPDTAPGRTP